MRLGAVSANTNAEIAAQVKKISSFDRNCLNSAPGKNGWPPALRAPLETRCTERAAELAAQPIALQKAAGRCRGKGIHAHWLSNGPC